MPQQASNEVEGLYNELGTGYEDAFGQNPAQIHLYDQLFSSFPQQALFSISDAAQGSLQGANTMIDAVRKNVLQGEFEVVDMLDYRGPSTQPDAIFTIFATFALGHDETMQLMEMLGNRLQPNGLLFVGSMSAEELDTAECTARDAETGTVKRWFIGNQVESRVYTKQSWEHLAEMDGFEIVTRTVESYTPRTTQKTDWEPRLYLTVRKST
ncbi:hypothetical protein CERZMDRAFT_96265 [Cercospora zeae-maydis SCOH1-5]|uniref:Methyltransferase domain-containing protein n=1 Tax=Cercospora zeae-maydis SCOH1-5 TaxID=717836 RepID=A0A6A6FJ68_9PEZI|nr:hypothetical protein CERZMDRAFT_96265 [Cercospora zeae-maydis SCOH1-5]